MQRKFSWHSFVGGRKKKYGMCFCTWHFLQFSSHLAQSGVGCLWPPPSTSTFTDNYTTTQAKGHTKLLRILTQYKYPHKHWNVILLMHCFWSFLLV